MKIKGGVTKKKSNRNISDDFHVTDQFHSAVSPRVMTLVCETCVILYIIFYTIIFLHEFTLPFTNSVNLDQ